MGYKWIPGKSAKREYAEEMNKIEAFCTEYGISHSKSMDSYYFEINGQKYRVSNHTIESSNAHAYRETAYGVVQVREKYHEDTRQEDVFYIYAGKTRIMDIYTDLASGYELDHRGNVIK